MPEDRRPSLLTKLLLFHPKFLLHGSELHCVKDRITLWYQQLTADVVCSVSGVPTRITCVWYWHLILSGMFDMGLFNVGSGLWHCFSYSRLGWTEKKSMMKMPNFHVKHSRHQGQHYLQFLKCWKSWYYWISHDLNVYNLPEFRVGEMRLKVGLYISLWFQWVHLLCSF